MARKGYLGDWKPGSADGEYGERGEPPGEEDQD